MGSESPSQSGAGNPSITMNGACRKVVDMLWADVPGEAAAVGAGLVYMSSVFREVDSRAGTAGVSQRGRGFLAGSAEAMNGAAGWPTRAVRRMLTTTAANGRAWSRSRMRALPVHGQKQEQRRLPRVWILGRGTSCNAGRVQTQPGDHHQWCIACKQVLGST